MKFNPVDIPELQDLLQSLKASGPARPDEHNKSCVQAPGKTPDCFVRLPQEIIQELLILSQSKDVASFRLASRTIATSPLSARFWKSRFSEGYEYHYIIEAHGSKPGSWRALYDGVSRIQTSPGLINRKRLWNSALKLRNTLEQINGPCHGRSLCSFFEPDSPVDNADWFSARYGSTGPEGMFFGGVRVLRIRVFDVPAKFHRLFVSFVQLNHGTFISGFRFQQRNGDETLVGYIHRSREVPLSIPSQLDIYGWHLAFHESGIKAIAAVMEDETVSSWVGEHAGSSKRRLVGNLQRLSTLKAEFDALKLVSLSLPLPDKQFSVRDLYLWSPDIPRQGVQFNGRGGSDAYFNAGRRNISIVPYATVEFGGTHGQDNSQLIEIVGWAFGTPDDFGIQFIYTDPSKNKSIGRVEPLVDRRSRLNLRYSRTPFSIDGPGGETIISIHVAKREGPILKIQINLAREVVFSPLMSYTYNGPLTVIKPSGNTVIGFYYVLVWRSLVRAGMPRVNKVARLQRLCGKGSLKLIDVMVDIQGNLMRIQRTSKSAKIYQG
ncbi:hypothetical protein AK830_g2620 [Neonectria ditissima]|uniref:DUF7600 domain-containing protein n=1 Tax=Neonectria ditissima TaxID=78410 RepID=A0A0P7BTN7_9HYPO|nr:hypothetical protein AK830_g2620 [Neonectria ditissima]